MVRQFTDGEHMQHPKDTFSVSPAEVDQARNMLQSMVMDIAAKFRAQNGQGQAPANQAQEQLAQQQRLLAQRQQEQLAAQTQAMQAQQQLVQNQQQAQQGQPGPVPLSAANLEKNSQALKNQTQKAAKAPKAPMAPTTANPPFPFGASSPHGNPSYVGKTKEMNLQIPPRKKARLDKQGGSGSQTATPSPQQGTAKVPEPQQEPQQPPAPVLVCKDPECQSSVAGYATEEALQQHVEEEHVKPKANPLRFCLDNLAAALGLGPGGTAKKEQGPSQAQQLKATGPAMSRTASKQAQTPGNLGVQTPRSLDGGVGMTWSASSQGHNAKAGAVKTAASTSGSPDPWASSSLDAQELVNKLGFPNGISSVALDPAVLRSLTPKDTPESSKDGGPSEPNTEAAGDAASGDPGLGDSWYTLDDMDMDMVFDIDQAAAGGEAADPSLNKVSMDPSLLTDAGGLEPDWDDLGLDLQGPFTVDASQLSMGYS